MAESYRRAGYKVDGHKHAAAANGWKLLHTPSVGAAIQRAMAERAGRLELTADAVVAKLLAVYEKAMSEKPWQGFVAAKALELLGKHLPGFFKETVEHKGQIDHTLTAKVDARLLEVIGVLPLDQRKLLLAALQSQRAEPNGAGNGHRCIPDR
jgi:hypothetical protein